jgi:hypothetical protein
MDSAGQTQQRPKSFMAELGDTSEVVVDENAVLEKFEGDPLPENLVERVYLHNGEIVKHEIYENGEFVAEREIGG